MEIKLDAERIKALREKAQIYNQAISDAYAFIQDKIIDFEGTLYIPE